MSLSVVVGSYERVLFGYTFDITQRSKDNEKAQSLKSKFVCAAHEGCIKTVATSGNLLLSGSTDDTAKIFDISSQIELGTMNKHTGPINCAEFFSQSHVLTGSDDNTITIWRTEDWEPIKTLQGHKAPVLSLSIHPTGKLALSTSKDQTLKLWNLIKGKVAFSKSLEKVGDIVKWNLEGDHYIVVADNVIDIYNVSTGELTKSIKHPKRVLALQFIKNEIFAVGGEDCEITFYDLAGNVVGTHKKAHNTRIKGLSMVPAQKSKNSSIEGYLASISSDGSLKLWIVNSKATKSSIDMSLQLLTEKATDARLTCVDCKWVSTDTNGKETEQTSAVKEDAEMPQEKAPSKNGKEKRKAPEIEENKEKAVAPKGKQAPSEKKEPAQHKEGKSKESNTKPADSQKANIPKGKPTPQKKNNTEKTQKEAVPPKRAAPATKESTPKKNVSAPEPQKKKQKGSHK